MLFNKVLIGVDDSKYANAATEYGFELARCFKAEVGLVNIVEPMVMPQQNELGIMGSVSTPMTPDMEVVDYQNEASVRLLDQIVLKYGNDIPVSRFNETGPPAETIIDCAVRFNADVIVIGTHHRTGLDRFFMGSVAEYVVEHSTVPVLVIPLKNQ
jgi:nucleotide-binding universal stress UspA family protein